VVVVVALWRAATALALLEPVQDLLDILSREFFDLCFLLVRERLELIVPIAR
jgi:hypothetical protein